MELYYTIAGISFCICCPEEWIYPNDGVLAAFRTGMVKPDHTLEFSITEELSPPEGQCVYTQSDICVYQDGAAQIRYAGSVANGLNGAYMRIRRVGHHSMIQVKRQEILDCITPKLVLNALEAEHQIVQKSGLLLHASYISHNGKAILFTAPSGTGKSTQADLWCKLRGARLLNGDRAAVMREQEDIIVRGIPFAGCSGVFENESSPLEAIVYLSQAAQTRIEPLSGVRAFRSVWEGCSVNIWNSEDVALCTETVLDVIQRVPVFHLACKPDETAVEALENELKTWRCSHGE